MRCCDAGVLQLQHLSPSFFFFFTRIDMCVGAFALHARTVRRVNANQIRLASRGRQRSCRSHVRRLVHYWFPPFPSSSSTSSSPSSSSA